MEHIKQANMMEKSNINEFEQLDFPSSVIYYAEQATTLLNPTDDEVMTTVTVSSSFIF